MHQGIPDEDVAFAERRKKEWLRDLDERRRVKEQKRAAEKASKPKPTALSDKEVALAERRFAEQRMAEWMRDLDERRLAKEQKRAAEKASKTKPTTLSDEEVALAERRFAEQRRAEWMRDLEERRLAKEQRRAAEKANKEGIDMGSSSSTTGSSKPTASPAVAESSKSTAPPDVAVLSKLSVSPDVADKKARVSKSMAACDPGNVTAVTALMNESIDVNAVGSLPEDEEAFAERRKKEWLRDLDERRRVKEQKRAAEKASKPKPTALSDKEVALAERRFAEQRMAEWMRDLDERRLAKEQKRAAEKASKTKPTTLSDEEVALAERRFAEQRRAEWMRDLEERRLAKEQRRAAEKANKEGIDMGSSSSKTGPSKPTAVIAMGLSSSKAGSSTTGSSRPAASPDVAVLSKLSASPDVADKKTRVSKSMAACGSGQPMNGGTILQLTSVQQGQTHCVPQLLSAPSIEVNQPKASGATPLNVARAARASAAALVPLDDPRTDTNTTTDSSEAIATSLAQSRADQRASSPTRTHAWPWPPPPPLPVAWARPPLASGTPFAKTAADHKKGRASQRSHREVQEATRRVSQRPRDVLETHELWESVIDERPSGLPPKQQDQMEGAAYKKELNDSQRRAEIERLAKLQRLRANWFQEGHETSPSTASKADRKSVQGRLYAVNSRWDSQAPAPRVYGK